MIAVTLHFTLYTLPCLFAAEDIRAKLNDSNGVSKFAIQDSNASTVATIDSDGNLVLVGSATITATGSNCYGLTVSTGVLLSTAAGSVGIGTVVPTAKLEVQQLDTSQRYSLLVGTATTAYHLVVSTFGVNKIVWADGTVQVSSPAAGGGGGGKDNLGNHIATMTLTANYGIVTTTITASTGTFSGYVNAAMYLVNNSTMVAILPGIDSIAYGVYAGTSNLITANLNTFIGNYAGQSNTTGCANTFLGEKAGCGNSTGGSNTFLGYRAGYLNIGGTDNIFLGADAGYYNNANYNTFIGNDAGYYNNANYNTFIGNYAGYINKTGVENTFLGYRAGRYNSSGGYNTVSGSEAGFFNMAGSANSIFGYGAGGCGGSVGNSFSSSTIMGYQAGYGITTGSDNTLYGWNAGYNITTGARNIIIGYNINTPTVDTNDYLSIGNLIFATGGFGTGTAVGAGNVGIGTTNPQTKFDVSGGSICFGNAGRAIGDDSANYRTRFSSNVYIVGYSSAAMYYGDGSGLYNVAGGGADNLGNHNATTRLNMNNNPIISVSSLTIIAPTTIPTSLWVSTSATTPHLYVSTAGCVGIGTINPLSTVSVAGSLVCMGSTGAMPVEEGYNSTRLMWYPAKSAFRAGCPAIGGELDADIGSYSTAFGNEALASGDGSFAAGDQACALGNISVAIGSNVWAMNSNSVVIGNTIVSYGVNSIAIGNRVQTGTGGVNAVVIGRGVSDFNPLINNTTDSLMIGFNSTISTLFVSSSTGVGTTGKVGIGTSVPTAKLEVQQTDTSQRYSLLVGTNTTAYHLVVSTFGVNKIVWADGTVQVSSPAAGGGWVGTATSDLNMFTYKIINVSTITTSGDSIVISPYSPSDNYNYAISIGSGAYNNHDCGIGIGYCARENISGIGIGNNALGNYSGGVGVGAYANSNQSGGVGVGTYANSNHSGGVGVGAYASGNASGGVGVGTYSQNNHDYGTGVGAYTSSKSSSVALGCYAKANRVEAVALGAGANANALRSVAIGAFCTNNDTDTVKIREGYTLKVDSINVSGSSVSSLTISTNVVVGGQVKIGNYTLPNADGISNRVLKTDGSGMVTWQPDITGAGGNSIGEGDSNITVTDVGVGTITFTTDGTEVMRVTGGNVGIGTTNPNNALQVANLVNFNNATYSVYLGTQAGGTGTGTSNLCVGYLSGYGQTTASSNVAVGCSALYANTNGNGNTAVGYMAGATGNDIINFTDNTFIGCNAGRGAKKGSNVYIGSNAGLTNNPYAEQNVIIGTNAGANDGVGYNNTIIGAGSAYYNANGGNSNVVVGCQSAASLNGGVANTILGTGAGVAIGNGNYNVLVGYQAGDNITSGASNIIIGDRVDAPSATGSGQINIGNTIYGSTITGRVGISSATPSVLLTIGDGTQTTAGYGLNFGEANANLYRCGSNYVKTDAYYFYIGSDYLGQHMYQTNDTNAGILLGGNLTTVANYGVGISNRGNQMIWTSGAGGSFSIPGPSASAVSFAPVSGNGVYNAINVAPTINQTGGANGITRGLYVNPTLTSASDFRAIEANGKVVINGSFSLPIVTKTATYTANGTDYTILGDATSAGFTINLPTAAGIAGRIYIIKKIDSSINTVIVDPAGSETIDGGATYTITTQYGAITIQSDGTNWMVLH